VQKVETQQVGVEEDVAGGIGEEAGVQKVAEEVAVQEEVVLVDGMQSP